MPIEADSLEAAAKKFQDHLNSILAKTVTQARLVLFHAQTPHAPPQIEISFRQGGKPTEARMKSKYGTMYLHVSQKCESSVEKRRHRLRTAKYRYALRLERMAAEPLFRWEYERRYPDDNARWCRHHLQGQVPLTALRAGLCLNDLHLPTGFTPLEEVLRFCIVDLGVKPLSRDWHDVLEDSYSTFRSNFVR